MLSRIIILLLLAAPVLAREVRSIDDHWDFQLQGESSSRVVNLPHDWSIEGEYKANNPAGGRQAYLPCGIATYRRTIDAPPEWTGKNISIEFDAAYMNSVVAINGIELGKRPYGFISFAYDLTQHLKPGKNELSVKLDNSQLPSARWYTGSGIYSHVRLVVTEPQHIVRSGVFVTTPDMNTVHVHTEITGETKGLSLVSELHDDSDQLLATAKSDVLTPAVSEQGVTIKDAKLWSPDSPNLYKMVSKLYWGDRLLDETATPFGFRKTRWDANTGFWLNDQNIKLQGVCLHWDHGPLGSAIPDRFVEARLRQLKEMGCNAIRTGHTPFPPVFYDFCDRIGIMVMDECFDGWRKKAEHDYGQQAFAEWWQRDLHDFILRDRNHPSVVVWSIGNETGGADKFGMTTFIHDLDPTRSTTGGQVHTGVDIAGFNGPGEFPGVLQKYHDAHPDQPIVLTEEPHTYQTRGFYRAVTTWRNNNPAQRTLIPSYAETEIFTDNKEHQYNSSYDNYTFQISARSCWKRTKETPWISGEFRWTGFDYLGESGTYGRHWPMRFAGQGIIDPGGFAKDIYYFYQSQWTTKPMVHLLPHWTHPDLIVETRIPVVAYSNCDEVELFLNSKSLGTQKPRDVLDFVWNVPYVPGEIKAIGYRAGKEVAKAAIRTAGAADHLDVQADRKLGLVTVMVKDKSGELVPNARTDVEFSCSNGAKLLGIENGDPEDVTRHSLLQRKTFQGLLRAFFVPDSGEIDVILPSSDGKSMIQHFSLKE